MNHYFSSGDVAVRIPAQDEVVFSGSEQEVGVLRAPGEGEDPFLVSLQSSHRRRGKPEIPELCAGEGRGGKMNTLEPLSNE